MVVRLYGQGGGDGLATDDDCETRWFSASYPRSVSPVEVTGPHVMVLESNVHDQLAVIDTVCFVWRPAASKDQVFVSVEFSFEYEPCGIGPLPFVIVSREP